MGKFIKLFYADAIVQYLERMEASGKEEDIQKS